MTVDHHLRRRRIAEVAASVIAREGLDAATIRRIAAELSGPTKLVTYYFREKQELLHCAWEHIAEQYVEQLTALDPTDILGRLLVMAAAGESGVTRWRVYAAFLDRAARDPGFAELQRRHIELALELIADMVRAVGVEAKDVDRISLLLNAMVQGISVQAIADPQRWTAERIRSALSDQVEMLLGRAVPGV